MGIILKEISEAVLRITDHPSIGILYAMISSVFMSFGHFVTSVTLMSTNGLSAFGIYFVHCAIQIILLIPFLLLLRTRIFFPSDRWLHLFTMSLSRFLCDISMFYAVSIIPVTITVAIFGLTPFFATFLSHYILKENCIIFDSMCVLLNVIGVIFITRSPAIFNIFKRKEAIYLFKESSGDYKMVFTFGCLISLLSSVTGSLTFVLQRKWAKSKHGKESGSFLINVLYSSVIGCFVTPFIMILTEEKFAYPNATFAKWGFVAIGICTTIGLTALAVSLKSQYAAVIALIRNFDVIFLYAFESIDVYVPISWFCIVGTGFISTSVIFITCRDRINFACGLMKDDDDEEKKKIVS